MKAIESIVHTYNVALNQNTPVGKELEELRRGIDFARICYQNIKRATEIVKAGEQTTEEQVQVPQGIVASIAADIEGASRETMGQVQGTSELQGKAYNNQYSAQEKPKKQPDINDLEI